MNDPLQPFLEKQGVLLLDGGLATELEARGCDLSDELWSARLLRDAPEAIRRLHLDYLEAGADCIISASYQATIPGFMRQGMTADEAASLIGRSVRLAQEAVTQFWSERANRRGRLRPLVAASVGPYGAFLADGSEYSGRYGLTEEELVAFHRRRWHILADSAPALLACETIPSAPEARALARLLTETPEMPVWFSFSCRDGQHISDGTPLAEAVVPLSDLSQVVALGVNCTAPRYIPALIGAARTATAKPIVVYPNSGETYDVQQRVWCGPSPPGDLAQKSARWRSAGAALLGGCCRTGPAHIRQMRVVLTKNAA